MLAEGERWSISGLCGRIWTLARDYPTIDDPAAFERFDEPRSVRVLFAHWVVPGDGGTSTIVSEARVAPTDRVAAARLRALWLVVGPVRAAHRRRAAGARGRPRGSRGYA